MSASYARVPRDYKDPSDVTHQKPPQPFLLSCNHVLYFRNPPLADEARFWCPRCDRMRYRADSLWQNKGK